MQVEFSKTKNDLKKIGMKGLRRESLNEELELPINTKLKWEDVYSQDEYES